LGTFRPDEDLARIVRIRDMIFGNKELEFTDVDGDVIKLRRERSSHFKSSYSINQYVNGVLEERDVEKFDIDLERRRYEDIHGQGEFKPEEDLGKIARLRNTLFGVNMTSDEPQTWGAWLRGRLQLVQDRSFDGHVAWSQYIKHGPIALGTVALNVSATRSEKRKSDTRLPAKVYWHRYMGVFGRWLPLPYLPQPGQKANSFGIGFCMLSHCACFPDYWSKPSKTGTKKSKDAGRGCWRFDGGKSAAFKAMLAPMALLFYLWLKNPGLWKLLKLNCTLSMENIRGARFYVVFTAPFSHLAIGEVLTSAIFLASTIDAFDRAGVSLVVFFLLFFGGGFASWLARDMLWHRLLKGNPSAFYMAEYGGASGLAAQLVFMAIAHPEEQFFIFMYFATLPFALKAWMCLLIHAVAAALTSCVPPMRVVVGLGVAWVYGFFIFDGWKLHLEQPI
jgi:hypothetical protein